MNFMKALIKRFSSIERELAFRTYDKYTTVKTDLRPAYYDKDTLMLHACFALLVDFVEIELASIMAITDQASQNRQNSNFTKRVFLFVKRMFSKKRDERAGRMYLQKMLDSRHGYVDAEDYWARIKELYEWWKDVRPQRTDPIESTGFSNYLRFLKVKYGDIYYFSSSATRTVELKSFLNTEEDSKFLDLALKSELLAEQYDDEDDEMLLKLCGLRRFLWT